MNYNFDELKNEELKNNLPEGEFVFDDVNFHCLENACLDEELFYCQQSDMENYGEGEWFGTVGELFNPLDEEQSLKIEVLFEHIDNQSQININIYKCPKGRIFESEDETIANYTYQGEKAEELEYNVFKSKIEELVRPLVKKVNGKISIIVK